MSQFTELIWLLDPTNQRVYFTVSAYIKIYGLGIWKTFMENNGCNQYYLLLKQYVRFKDVVNIRYYRSIHKKLPKDIWSAEVIAFGQFSHMK